MPDIEKLNVGGTDFDIDDPNDVEKEGGELLDTVINYDSASTPSISSFTEFLNQFVSGTKVGQWFKNFRAGCDFILHIGSLVNNCVTDNEALPLAAAQGKVLMDEITELNSALSVSTYTVTSSLFENLKVYKMGRIVFIFNDETASLKTLDPSDGWLGDIQLPEELYPITAVYQYFTAQTDVHFEIRISSGGYISFYARSSALTANTRAPFTLCYLTAT